jgi:hypothetical protein
MRIQSGSGSETLPVSYVVDPDPHLSDKLDPDPHLIQDDKPNCMEYDPI